MRGGCYQVDGQLSCQIATIGGAQGKAACRSYTVLIHITGAPAGRSAADGPEPHHLPA